MNRRVRHVVATSIVAFAISTAHGANLVNPLSPIASDGQPQPVVAGDKIQPPIWGDIASVGARENFVVWQETKPANINPGGMKPHVIKYNTRTYRSTWQEGNGGHLEKPELICEFIADYDSAPLLSNHGVLLFAREPETKNAPVKRTTIYAPGKPGVALKTQLLQILATNETGILGIRAGGKGEFAPSGVPMEPEAVIVPLVRDQPDEANIMVVARPHSINLLRALAGGPHFFTENFFPPDEVPPRLIDVADPKKELWPWKAGDSEEYFFPWGVSKDAVYGKHAPSENTLLRFDIDTRKVQRTDFPGYVTHVLDWNADRGIVGYTDPDQLPLNPGPWVFNHVALLDAKALTLQAFDVPRRVNLKNIAADAAGGAIYFIQGGTLCRQVVKGDKMPWPGAQWREVAAPK